MKSLIIYPGTFNPLHAGHLAIAQWAERYYTPSGAKVWPYIHFDVARYAYEKDIAEWQYKERCQAIIDLGRSIWSSHERSFLRKEWFYRNQVDRWYCKYYIYFLVGIDTAERIDNPKYYCDSEVERTDTLESYDERTRFVVFGRNGKEYDKDNFSPAFQKLAIKAEGFVPVNVSSTELRSKE
jgi:nicotinic acid mononucleotide adenylyltransferase